MAVDWDYVVEGNRDALKRILAMLVAMASAAAFTSPLWGGRAAGAGGDIAQTPTRPSDDSYIRDAARPSLPRHLYRAVLAILHPAESAARRLIVVAARGLVLSPPRPKPSAQTPKRKPRPTAIVFPHGAAYAARHRALSAPPPPRAVPARICLPLFDTLRPPARRLRSVPASMAPRISVPGLTVLHRLPQKPTPDDPVDATRLNLRLQALAAVLDDLPKEALRFARWRARRDARLSALLEGRTQEPGRRPDQHLCRHPGRQSGGRRPGTRPAAFRIGRLSPLRPGRAPGSRRKGRREVHEILANLQHFALEVLEGPDTS